MKKVYTTIIFALILACSLCAQNSNVDYFPHSNDNFENNGYDQNSFTQDPDRVFNGEIKIFPNPATDFFRINTDEKIGSVQVLNVLGNVIKQYDKFHGDYYELSGVAPGIYFIKIDHANSNKSRTIRLKVQ